ncbi:hypothetical protein ACQ4M4_02980 [Leptolyngbya sp. AN02str]|uniref:hypothetical protein n=1 Tax=Leptolyngbya sp. AN02str TaxID=3423363 RepID=UPI003D312A43
MFRSHYREEAMRYDHVHFFPLGCNRDLEQFIDPKPTGDRTHVWSFAGTVRGRISRRQMLANANQFLVAFHPFL